MDNLISIENLVEQAKKRGVDFGKGDPYNRLRYYTKIGWLPHMIRKKDSTGNTRGHYYNWALDRLVEIEKLKDSGLDNRDISKKLNVTTRFKTLVDFLKTRETRNQLALYGSFIILLLILSNELGIIRLGRPKSALTANSNVNLPVEQERRVIATGTAFIPKNQKNLFIQTTLANENYKVHITFKGDYSPAARFWVSKIENAKGFTVELDTPVFNNTEFTWWITN